MSIRLCEAQLGGDIGDRSNGERSDPAAVSDIAPELTGGPKAQLLGHTRSSRPVE